mgnify:CR=1 FL=1
MKLQYRVKKNEDFSKIIEEKKVLKFKTVVIYFIKSSYNHSRFGLSVSKKLGNAVTRNLIKRRLRAIIKDLFVEDLCVDFVVIARSSICRSTMDDIKKDMLKFESTIRENINGKEA